MSIEKITERILQEAKEEADKIILDAEAKAMAIEKETAVKVDKIIEDAKTLGEAEKNKVIEQKKAVADIDGRKVILEKKQEMIQSCFLRAITKIMTMDKKQYLEFLLATVKETKCECGELIFTKEDLKLADELLSLISKENIGEFTVAEETHNEVGGLIIRNGAVRINATVESLISQVKDELSYEVATVLF